MRLSHLELVRLTVKRFFPRLRIVVALVPALFVVPASSFRAPIGRRPGGSSRRYRYHEHQQLTSSGSSTRLFHGRVGRRGAEAVGATTVTVQNGAKRSVRLPEDHLLRPAFQKLEQVLTRCDILLQIRGEIVRCTASTPLRQSGSGWLLYCGVLCVARERESGTAIASAFAIDSAYLLYRYE